MMTLRLWRALHYIPEMHPVFQHIHYARNRADVRYVWAVVIAIGGVMLVSTPGLFVFNILIFPLIYSVFNVTLNTVVWAMNICTTITNERSRNTYDLLCLTPDGGLVINWIIGAEAVNYRDVLNRASADTIMLLQIIGVFPILASIAALFTPGIEQRDSTLVVTLTITAVVIYLSLDFMQSVVTGCLLAMLTANRITNANDARMWTLGLFLTIQMITYVALLASVMVGAMVLANTPTIPSLMKYITPFIITLIFLMIRELAIRGLFRVLTDTLNGDPAQLIRSA